MAGVFPVDLVMEPRPVGHGYTRIRIDGENPFFDVGEELKGHEFHYSKIVRGLDETHSCMLVERGTGIGSGRDGMTRANTLAVYTHIHADGVPGWAPAFVSRAREYRDLRKRCAGNDLNDDHHPVYNKKVPDTTARTDTA